MMACILYQLTPLSEICYNSDLILKMKAIWIYQNWHANLCRIYIIKVLHVFGLFGPPLGKDGPRQFDIFNSPSPSPASSPRQPPLLMILPFCPPPLGQDSLCQFPVFNSTPSSRSPRASLSPAPSSLKL